MFVGCMVFDEVLLLPKPCNTKNAPRRSEDLSPHDTCTTPESLSPAEEKVTGCSVMGNGLHRDRSDPWRSRIGSAPLRAAPHPGHETHPPFGLPSPSSLQRA